MILLEWLFLVAACSIGIATMSTVVSLPFIFYSKLREKAAEVVVPDPISVEPSELDDGDMLLFRGNHWECPVCERVDRWPDLPQRCFVAGSWVCFGHVCECRCGWQGQVMRRALVNGIEYIERGD